MWRLTTDYDKSAGASENELDYKPCRFEEKTFYVADRAECVCVRKTEKREIAGICERVEPKRR
jgi:hypothetical protein